MSKGEQRVSDERKEWQESADSLKELLNANIADSFDSIEAFYLLDCLEAEIMRLERAQSAAAAEEKLHCHYANCSLGHPHVGSCNEEHAAPAAAVEGEKQ